MSLLGGKKYLFNDNAFSIFNKTPREMYIFIGQFLQIM